MSNISNRMQGPTPKFFKTLRNIGVALAAVSAAVFELPVELPTIMTDMAGYPGCGRQRNGRRKPGGGTP